MAFRSRRFEPVPPSERRRRSRRAARLLVRHDAGVLLLRDTDPGIPGATWWTTPGGGLDPGESWAEAALRELREETGFVCPTDRLIGPIAERHVVHGYSDQITEQHELFFEVWISDAQRRAGISTAGFTEGERLTLVDHGWFTAGDLPGLTVWPANLAGLLDRGDVPLLQLGWVEESTVPVSDSGAAPHGC